MLSGVPSDDVQPSEAADHSATSRLGRLLHVPKAVLVTLLGLAVSAWLLPALTRQWDDRQREHELKAAIVADIATSTARAVVGSEGIWEAVRPPTKEERERIGDQWALSALEIESQLRSYFPRDVVASWQLYSWAVDRFIGAYTVSAAAALENAVTSGGPLDSRVSDAAAQLLVLGENTLGEVPEFGGTNQTDDTTVRRLERMLSSDMALYRKQYETTLATWRGLEKRVLGLEQAVADQILHSNAAGFSTTSRELFDDLLP